MRLRALLVIAALVPGCTGDDSTTPSPGGGGGPDASLADSSRADVSVEPADSASADVAPRDAGSLDAACPSSWTVAPVTDPALAVPDGGGGVLLHASAIGTQDYACTASVADAGAPDADLDAGDAAPAVSHAWVFVGPEAALSDCNAAVIGHHFSSDAGPSQPEWQSNDGAYVIGKKVAGVTIDGGAAIPWLLVQALANGGTSALSHASFVQRLNTTGGLAPTSACDDANVGATVKVPYTADYYFYGP